MWDAAIKLARSEEVEGLSDDGDEIALRVKSQNRSLWHEVYLWPGDLDSGCDCGREDVCVHVCAAVVAIHQGTLGSVALPEPKAVYQVQVVYVFTSRGPQLSLQREARWNDGRQQPIRRSLDEADLVATRADRQADRLLQGSGFVGGQVPPDLLRTLLTFLEGDAVATLDGEPVKVSTEPVTFRVRVTDEGEGFRVGLYRPTGIDKLYRGAAMMEGTLHPTSHGTLGAQQRRMLVRGVSFGPEEVASLVGETLPNLERRIPVDLHTQRLPRADSLVPQVRVRLAEEPGGLRVISEIVYGDPPVARVTIAGVFESLTMEVVPARDPVGERVVQREYRELCERPVGVPWLLRPEDAATFLRDILPQHKGPVVGSIDPTRFVVKAAPVIPGLHVEKVKRTRSSGQEEFAWKLDLSFESEEHNEADPYAVLSAWREGRSLVPLLDGGYAPLPEDWLEEHGALLQELLDARDKDGLVARQATAALVELLEEVSEVPPDLRTLRSFLEGGEGLPDVDPPETLQADLRGYQRAGYQWLSFLRDMELHGILADDMGLGKTVQAIGALCDLEGPHLVVAPTSVIQNWASEIEKFAPSLTVNVYHGASRSLGHEHVTITSYALLRLDLLRLQSVPWNYVVLDEAQAIKNPASQTAKSACAIEAQHRLVLTGTPIENRLEELWSLFRFLMPGLLGSRTSFRERFVRPVEEGNPNARRRLHGRIRPYVLRRLKSQVAKELPALTEMVVRCTMGPEQRKVYDAVRLTARRDVQEALARMGEKKVTFQVLEALLRMRQACCDPSLLPGDVGEDAASAKLDRMEEMLVNVVSDGHRVLIFSQWTQLLDRVEPRLEELGITWVRLDGSTKDRKGVIDRFQDPSGPPVFLLSLKAGGTGLNLTAADYVLHLDPWWNPAVEQQATDRAHRIGQERPVVSCKLIAADTVEERILELQAAKRNLVEAALGTEGGFLQALSGTELRALFDSA
jgi:hypothetical protein